MAKISRYSGGGQTVPPRKLVNPPDESDGPDAFNPLAVPQKFLPGFIERKGSYAAPTQPVGGQTFNPQLQTPANRFNPPRERFSVADKYKPNFRQEGPGERMQTVEPIEQPGYANNNTLAEKRTLPGVSRYTQPAATEPGQKGFQTKRDGLGYAVSAAQMALGALPTKKVGELKQQKLELTNRTPTGMNYSTKAELQNQLQANADQTGKARTSDATLNMVSRYGANAQKQDAQGRLASQDDQTFQQQQQQHDQVSRQQEQANNQIANQTDQTNWNRKLEDQRAISERKGAMLQTGAQNMLAQRSAENSAANQVNSQMASLDVMQLEGKARNLVSMITAKGDEDGTLQAELDSMHNTPYSELYGQKMEQYGGLKRKPAQRKEGGLISRYSRGGRVLDDSAGKTYRQALSDNSSAARQLREITAKFIMLAGQASANTVAHATRRIIKATK